jgi:hypothetical protein
MRGYFFIYINSEHRPMRGACENNPIYMGYFSLPYGEFEPNMILFLIWRNQKI